MGKKRKIIIAVIILIVLIILLILSILDEKSKNTRMLEEIKSLVTLQSEYEEDFEIEGYTIDDPNVIVTGFVDDLRDYYGKCTVFIAPLLTGSGIKNKVLEAMAAGIPVISSSIGIDGIDVENGYHLLVADEVTQWRDMIVDLLNNSQKRDYLANNAQIYVKDNYDWNTVIEQYFSQFSSLLK